MIIKPILQFACWTVPVLSVDGLRLLGFVTALSPGFARFAWFYCVAAKRSSVSYYNESCRQTLDVYEVEPCVLDDVARASLPNNGHITTGPDPPLATRKHPVVIFCSGGAWIIGYKMWGALLARALTAAGIVVVIPDYRNYPFATVPDMVKDVQRAVVWTKDNISSYNGDPDRMVLVGQSAGGHLACVAMLYRVMRMRQDKDGNTDDSLPRTSTQPAADTDEQLNAAFDQVALSGFISLSAPLDLNSMHKTFRRHGLHENIMNRIFDERLADYSPLGLAEVLDTDARSLEGELPPTAVYHGTNDKTVPHCCSTSFTETLQRVFPSIKYHAYEGYSHTDAILEGPMSGDHFFHRDLFQNVKEWTGTDELRWVENPVISSRLCPNILIRIARFLNPF